IADALRKVPGIVDVAMLPVLGKPEMNIHIDRARCARYGVQVADVEAVIQGAVGVKAFTQMVEGEKTFDVILRLPPELRSDPSKIASIPIDIANSVPVASAGTSAPASSGTAAVQPGLTGNPVNLTGNTFGGLGRIPLRDLADIEIKTGPSMIYREHHRRFVAVKFAVRGRDLATAVTEAQHRVDKRVGRSLPPGYTLDWGGEYKQ